MFGQDSLSLARASSFLLAPASSLLLGMLSISKLLFGFRVWGGVWGLCRDVNPNMENQMDKKMDNDIETRISS